MNPAPPNIAPSSSLYGPQPTDGFASDAAATAAAALSQGNSPQSPSQHVSNGRKRKASGVPGSRGVANLTPEQLAKKRANDREAQRAIRERTKVTIETLEKRIQELESQQPFQELQRVAHERDRALAECEQLRNKLAMVQSVIGDHAAGQQAQPNLHELATLTAQQSPLPSLNEAQSQQRAQSDMAQQFGQQYHLHPELRSPHSDSRSTTASQSIGGGTSYPMDGTPLRRWSPATEPTPNSHFATPNGSSYGSRLPPPSAMLDYGGTNGDRLDLNYVLEPKQHSASISPVVHGPLNYPTMSSSDRPLYERLPVNTAASCPLDSLLSGFLAESQKQVRDGVPMAKVLGPDYPTWAALRDPSPKHAKHSAHPLSALTIDILSKFPIISGLPERVGSVFIMFLVMRWMICPCKPCYERLPEWSRPLKEQLEIPHPTWYDYVPWPAIRLGLITRTPEVRFDNFFVPFMTRLSVNWPYPTNEIFADSGQEGGASEEDVRMSPVFESHLMRLHNWSIANVFKTTFPHLVDDSIRIQD